jgi:hypothetical protein
MMSVRSFRLAARAPEMQAFLQMVPSCATRLDDLRQPSCMPLLRRGREISLGGIFACASAGVRFGGGCVPALALKALRCRCHRYSPHATPWHGLARVPAPGRRVAPETGGRSRALSQLAQLALVRYPLRRIRRPWGEGVDFSGGGVVRFETQRRKMHALLKRSGLNSMRLVETHETRRA